MNVEKYREEKLAIIEGVDESLRAFHSKLMELDKAYLEANKEHEIGSRIFDKEGNEYEITFLTSITSVYATVFIGGGYGEPNFKNHVFNQDPDVLHPRICYYGKPVLKSGKLSKKEAFMLNYYMRKD